jgi:hypothetical protein
VIFLKEAPRRESGKADLATYICPECGESFENVSTTESHLDKVYELHLKAWHEKPL